MMTGTSSRTRVRYIGTLLVAAALSACKGATTESFQTPSALAVQTGTQQTGTVGSTLATPLTVVVTDNNGRVISGARVDWDASAGSGSTSPSASITDSKGVAQTLWTLGTVVGTARVTAQVSGVSPVTFSATVIAGTAASVIAIPEQAFLGVGDTLILRATVRDRFSNVIAGQAITFTSVDPTVATVSSTGLLRAVSIGTTRIIADASGKSDTVPLTVLAAGASSCGPVAVRALAVGEVFTPAVGASSAVTCLAAPSVSNAEFALTLISTSNNFASVTPIDVYAVGNAGPTTSAIVAGISSVIPSAQNATTIDIDASPSQLSPAAAAERARHELERQELAPLVASARQWHTARVASLIKSAAIDAKVGDIIKLNANANQGCSNPDTRTGRVAAVGARALVVADTANPSGGYTDSEYANIAATFDTLIYPMDTTAFGAPSNISAYGKIILFFTRNVNALTPTNASFTIGGFFFSRDLYPKVAKGTLQSCPASNEQEMFYLLVPDPNGTVNNNRRSKDQVSILNTGTIAHEFQHLINSSRRLYVNLSAAPSEETWLDEGLAHTAEELLFFRVSGLSSRQNIGLPDLRTSPTTLSQFNNYAVNNFSRFNLYLTNPETNSPYAPNDSLATRGSTWNFLRYAAGRQGAGGEAAFYRAVVNSNTTGNANLRGVIPGGAFVEYLRDWTVSLIADDFSVATTAALDPRYIIPAWNFRSIYPGIAPAGGNPLGVYPINARSLQSNAPQRIALPGGGSSYIRFSVATGRTALLTLSSNGAAPPGDLQYAVVRLR